MNGKTCTLPKGWAVKLTPENKSGIYDKGYIFSKDTAIMQFYQNIPFTNVLDTSAVEILVSDTTEDHIYYITKYKQYYRRRALLVESKNDSDESAKFYLFTGFTRTPFIESEILDFYERLKKTNN